MASLKEKATGKKGKLASKASGSLGKPLDHKEELRDAQPNVGSGLSFNAPPALPPALKYVEFLAAIPGLRGSKVTP